MLPTADDVARAIVAAARETGEDPIGCIRGEMGQRCRHYAMHALVHVFGDMPRDTAAQLVGCPGKPRYFWNNSWGQVVKPNWNGRPKANWWDAAALSRVIKAIEPPADLEQGNLRLPCNMQRAVDMAKAAFPASLDKLNVRRRVVPAHDCDNVTSDLMGDPPPGRSALANR